LTGDDLTGLPEDRILAMMSRHLQARMAHAVGSALWMDAVTGYADCQAELDRRLLQHIMKVVRERGDML